MSDEEKPIPNPVSPTDSAETPEKPKRKLPAALEKKKWLPGVSGNPSGLPSGKSPMNKRLTKFSQIWGRVDAPDDWFGDTLAYARRQGLTIDELIMIRVKWCLATNTRYQNTALLVETLNRHEGKIPLRVLHKDAVDGDDDMDTLTDEELQEYLDKLDRRARAARERADTDAPEEPEPGPTGQTE